MPRSTWAGIVLAGMATVAGFALIWQIWWLAILGIVSIIGTAIFHTFNYDRSYHIHAEHIAEVEAARTAQLAAAAKKEPLHEQSRQHPGHGRPDGRLL
jgi:cytochrome o ubiquinol oxidase subunit 1